MAHDEGRQTGLHERMRDVLAIPLHRFLGLRPVDPNDPAAGVLLETTPASLNQVNLLHGGVAIALLDVACYLALAPSLGPGEHAVTHDLSVQLLRPVPSGMLVHFRGKVLRAGKQVVFLRGEAVADGRLVASAQVTKSRVSAG